MTEAWILANLATLLDPTRTVVLTPHAATGGTIGTPVLALVAGFGTVTPTYADLSAAVLTGPGGFQAIFDCWKSLGLIS